MVGTKQKPWRDSAYLPESSPGMVQTQRRMRGILPTFNNNGHSVLFFPSPPQPLKFSDTHNLYDFSEQLISNSAHLYITK